MSEVSYVTKNLDKTSTPNWVKELNEKESLTPHKLNLFKFYVKRLYISLYSFDILQHTKTYLSLSHVK